MNKINIVDVSWMTYIRLVIVLAGLWLLWVIKDILFILLLVLIIVAVISPVVNKLSKKIPRLLAIILVYLLMVILLGLFSYLIFPPLVTEVKELSKQLPDLALINSPEYVTLKAVIVSSQEGLVSLAKELTNFSSRIYSTTLGFFGGIITVITVIILSFYLLIEEHGARNFIKQHLPIENRETTVEILRRVVYKIGSWIKAQLWLGLIVGLLNFVGLLIIGLPYAISLAIWTAVTELIPYVGPVLGGIPTVIVAFLFFPAEPIKWVLIIIWFTAVQQLEAQFLVPKIMQKVIGLSPVIIILSILVGGKIAGLMGVILAIPTAAIISVLIQEYPKIRKELK
ncbi:hypothetical protein COX60_02770 [Candidatus Berkelbacteria bacterium CG_4_10_14_0_2_um_filter_35_9_33_12]|uniref:AI-2E family transporter n=1 Tax=Candidatus Berkelbacteria bacterium CG_4_10_14_0_2_um_filter_35_9_33_12 TaxID=1974499 RepID=A0A2M7W3K0_9BACT|nr:MAG: hypothetical protein COX60_02770 [Candidatus Berkelbacteria bacterium CG_4_10_14_0_2_um_filter_35_9_33_12]